MKIVSFPLSLVLFFLFAVSIFARQVPITVLSTTDLHGTILPATDYEGNTNRGGIARLATKIGEIRARTPNVLLVDSGDLLQGTPASDLDKGLVIIKLVNHLKYDAWILGNHDFDWGTDVLSTCLSNTEASVLAGNLKPVTADAKRKFARVKPFVIKRVDGVNVAIVGLTTPGIPHWSRPRQIPGLEFESSTDALERILPQVKEAGAQVIVLAVHQGIRESGDDHANQLNAIVSRFPEITTILGGHTHRNWPEYKFPRSDAVYCQAGYWGTSLGRIDLVYDTESQKTIRRKSNAILMDESVPLDPRVLQLSSNECAQADARLMRAIGTATADFVPTTALHESSLHNLICESIAEALRERGVVVDGVVHGLLNARGMLKQGVLRVADVWNIVPYENTIGVAELTPAELKEVLEENARAHDRFRGLWGMRMGLKLNAPDGQRVLSLTDGAGKDLDEHKRYKIAFNSYDLASGGMRFPKLREIAERPGSKLVEYDFQTRDAVIGWIERRKEISPRVVGWWEFASKKSVATKRQTQ